MATRPAAVLLQDRVGDGVEEVGLPEAGVAVDEERVPGLAGVRGDRLRRGEGEAVRLADDEGVEGVARVRPDLAGVRSGGVRRGADAAACTGARAGARSGRVASSTTNLIRGGRRRRGPGRTPRRSRGSCRRRSRGGTCRARRPRGAHPRARRSAAARRTSVVESRAAGGCAGTRRCGPSARSGLVALATASIVLPLGPIATKNCVPRRGRAFAPQLFLLRSGDRRRGSPCCVRRTLAKVAREDQGSRDRTRNHGRFG